MTFRTVFHSIIPLLAATLLLSGCGGFFGNNGIAYRTESQAGSRLVFAADSLRGATVRYKVAKNLPAGQRIERARWDTRTGIMAELMLTEAPTGTRKPQDPRDLTGDFPGLIRLNASFGDLYQSETANGTALWRRFVAGDRTCMIFRQDLASRAEVPGSRLLSGYYCAGPGATFTVLDATATLRTVGLKQNQAKRTRTNGTRP